MKKTSEDMNQEGAVAHISQIHNIGYIKVLGNQKPGDVMTHLSVLL